MTRELQSIEDVVDLANAMENLDGDVELLREVLEIFLEMAPEMLDGLEGAIGGGGGDAVEVGGMAHSLKGSASNFCATRFVDAAGRLEYLAKGGVLGGAGDLMRELREEFGNLVAAQGAIDWNEVLDDWEA